MSGMSYLTLGSFECEEMKVRVGSMHSFYHVDEFGQSYVVTADDHDTAVKMLERDYGLANPELQNVCTHHRWSKILTPRAVIFTKFGEDIRILHEGSVTEIAEVFENEAWPETVYCCTVQRLRELVNDS